MSLGEGQEIFQMMLLSEYLQQPFDPERLTLDRILKDALEDQRKKQEREKQVKEMRRIWNGKDNF